MSQIPYWLKLLEFYYNSKNRTGLTLPFLIGSLSLIENSEENNISSLLIEMKNNSHTKVILKFCLTVQEFIVSISPNLLYGSVYNKIEFGNLIIIQTNGLVGINDFEDILTTLHLDYDKYINNNCYSKENEDWKYYNEDDQNMILEVLK